MPKRRYKKEDLEPYGWNWMKLGLQDVLFDVRTQTVYTPNTNQTVKLGAKKLIDNGSDDGIMEERGGDHNVNWTKGEHGYFTGSVGSSGGSGSSSETKDLSDKSYEDIIDMKGKMSDVDVRKWYLAHDKTIPDLIDKSLPIEEQAKQACELRNEFRTQARNLMADQKKRKELDITDPNKTFEELVSDKMSRKNLTRQQAIEDIIITSTKTRKSVNQKLGLEE